MISALTFVFADLSLKGRQSQLSVSVDEFDESQEQKEVREQCSAGKRTLRTSSSNDTPSDSRPLLHRKSVQWARRLSRMGTRPGLRPMEKASQLRTGLPPRSERQELAELVRNRMKNLGLSSEGYGEGLGWT